MFELMCAIAYKGYKMKVLWLCNIMLPVIAEQLHMEASNKEGWLSGLADALLKRRQENGIELSVAFPAGKIFPKEWKSFPEVWKAAVGEEKEIRNQAQLWSRGIYKTVIGTPKGEIVCYGFGEDVGHAEVYDRTLEERLKNIVEDAEPDLVHCFGTEYPHTLAMCRVFPRKDRILAGLQGLCTLYAEAYNANLPEHVIRSVTFRDYVKQDSLVRQKEKFIRRGEMEREAIGLAGNITGRTEWDREFSAKWNPESIYFHMNETLRKEFYGPVWDVDKCIPHSIFVSQGDYPLKGLHYVLSALPAILAEYPDAKVYVAGNSVTRCGTLKERLKLSAYGKYLIKLMEENGLEERVTFLGRLDAAQMRDRYLVSHLYLCPSALENSPNSLGEAMLLGMPCVSADVGGISSLFTGGEDGILYQGFQMGAEVLTLGAKREADRISESLAEAVIGMWGNPGRMREYCTSARKRALQTHDRDKNYRRLIEIYDKISKRVVD